jgi:hypothetical protein
MLPVEQASEPLDTDLERTAAQHSMALIVLMQEPKHYE